MIRRYAAFKTNRVCTDITENKKNYIRKEYSPQILSKKICGTTDINPNHQKNLNIGMLMSCDKTELEPIADRLYGHVPSPLEFTITLLSE
jgi:hypothetical protein